MELWLTEGHTKGYSVNWKVMKTLHVEETPYQTLAVVETAEMGRALVLDGVIQTTERDEFFYHEMIAHVPLFAHPRPEKALVIGGGDGGTVREILKHRQIRQVDLVEIDRQVIEASLKFLPSISCALEDPRVNIIIDDGCQYVKNREKEYDLIIVDSSDPVGPAAELFSPAFYAHLHGALKEDGLMVTQSDSPFYNADFVREIFLRVKAQFPQAQLYLTPVPTYMSGFWSFTVGSKAPDPSLPCRVEDLGAKYYSADLHRAAFVLPEFIRKNLEK